MIFGLDPEEIKDEVAAEAIKQSVTASNLDSILNTACGVLPTGIQSFSWVNGGSKLLTPAQKQPYFDHKRVAHLQARLLEEQEKILRILEMTPS